MVSYCLRKSGYVSGYRWLNCSFSKGWGMGRDFRGNDVYNGIVIKGEYGKFSVA